MKEITNKGHARIILWLDFNFLSTDLLENDTKKPFLMIEH